MARKCREFSNQDLDGEKGALGERTETHILTRNVNFSVISSYVGQSIFRHQLRICNDSCPSMDDGEKTPFKKNENILIKD